MSNEVASSLKSHRLAYALHRFGWSGFWVQIVIGSLPVCLMIYYFAFTRTVSGSRVGLRLVEYLTIANLLVLIFTTFWSYRYTLLAKRVANPEKRPPEAFLIRTVWTGVSASVLGILFSMTVMFIDVAHLLFYFLSAPQAGVPVIQTTGSGSASWVSAADMVTLMALILTLFAEMIVLAFGLWLLFRVLQGTRDSAYASK